MKKSAAILLSAAILGLGFFAAGAKIGRGMYEARKMNHVMTVKGLAEKDVEADLAIWDINYREIGDDLNLLNQKLSQDQTTVINFLRQQGFAVQELGILQIKVEDRLANFYNQNSQTNSPRYVLSGGIRVRANNVNRVQKTVQISGQLIQQGVSLAFDLSNLSPNPSYYFTKLDSIRPEMLTQATQSAQNVAAQFAKDLDSDIGKVLKANQGIFQIMSRDTSTMSSDWNSNINALGSIDKKIRLVTTIDYQLK